MAPVPHINLHGQSVGELVRGWTPRPRPGQVHLAGRYVDVVPLSLDHAAALYDALGGPGDGDLWTYRPQDLPADVAAMTGLIEEHLAAAGLVTFALVPADSVHSGPVPGGRAAQGIASYTRIDTGTGQVEVAGVLFAHSLQRTAAATEAIHLLMRHAFDLGYRRFEWKCDSLNEPSRRAASRLGFTYEGRFRNHMITKGRSRDTDWFSITDAEWVGIRREHERWLAPENFDDHGCQRTALRVPAAS